jgi:sugar lactone lactonase YvrE
MQVRTIAFILVLAVQCSLGRTPALAHPSSGIVVDDKGNVFVADINTGLWKFDTNGKLTQLHMEAGHWLALDAEGRFSLVDFEKSDHWPRWFKRRTPAGEKPSLITDGGSPLVVHPDGNLYYISGGEELNPGGHELIRLTPDGKLSRVAADLANTSEKLGGIKGLAVGPDGFFYITFPKAVYKISTDGKISAVAESIEIAGCNQDIVEGTPEVDLPSLRGLAIDSRGTVYAAATGCRRVVKITAVGRIETVLKSERPWSPTGISVQGDAIYVLEYPSHTDENRKDWVPRVRMVDKNGEVTTLVTFPGAINRARRNLPTCSGRRTPELPALPH